MKKISSVFSVFATLALSIAISSCDIGSLNSESNDSRDTGSATTTTVAGPTGPEMLQNSNFNGHTSAYLSCSMPIYNHSDPSANAPVDVWTDWVETQIRPEDGFSSLYDYESDPSGCPNGRVGGDLHAATMYAEAGNMATVLSQSVSVQEAGTYHAQIWVLPGYTNHTFSLKIAQESLVKGELVTQINNSDLLVAAVFPAPVPNWELLSIDVELDAGTTTFEIGSVIAGQGANRYARFDDASLKKL